MLIRRLAWLVALKLLLSSSQTVSAQDDLVFVGVALSDLRNAIHPASPMLRVKDPVLNRDLGGDLSNPPPLPLALLLIPRDANGTNPVVRKVYNDGRTRLQPHQVDPMDIAELRRLAGSGLVILLRSKAFTGDTTPGAQDFKMLADEIGQLPAAEREVARRYTGAILADRGVRTADSAIYVAEFRKVAEEKLASSIKAAPPFEMGKPYAYGTRLLTVRHVAAVSPETVFDFEVEGVNFKKAWVGSSVIVCKPSIFVDIEPKTGIGKMRFRPEVAAELKKGNDLPAKPLHSIARVERHPE